MSLNYDNLEVLKIEIEYIYIYIDFTGSYNYTARALQ